MTGLWIALSVVGALTCSILAGILASLLGATALVALSIAGGTFLGVCTLAFTAINMLGAHDS